MLLFFSFVVKIFFFLFPPIHLFAYFYLYSLTIFIILAFFLYNIKTLEKLHPTFFSYLFLFTSFSQFFYPIQPIFNHITFFFFIFTLNSDFFPKFTSLKIYPIISNLKLRMNIHLTLKIFYNLR
jgi:hypothetical protein